MSFRPSARFLFVVSLWVPVFSTVTAAAEPPAQTSTRTLTGVVRDSSGGAVSGAVVIVRATANGQSAKEQQTLTGADGQFTLNLSSAPSGDLTLIVRAGGFAESQQALTTATGSLAITLMPATLLETVVVTATRSEQRLGDVPASVDVLTKDDVQSSPAVIVDDVLKQVPTFSLFRRTSSIAAQPTTQGVSLRGLGPSGQSRTLVLLDGVPVNDPFGGWVYWTRVPMLSIDRIEMTEDPTSSLYGNAAMGGVISVVTARPTRRTVEFKPQYGNLSSPKADFFASDQWKKVGAAIEGSFFGTDGFPIVAAIERGPIDNNANVNYKNISAKLDFAPSDRWNGFFRASYFSENRNNAKVGELNDTRWTAINGGIRTRLADNSDLQARVYVDVERAHFNFLAVTNPATTRNIVRLATDQNVPTNAVGGAAQWAKAVGGNNLFTAGADWRWVDGDSVEDAYVAAVPASFDGVTQKAALSAHRISGGTQQITGAFVQDVFTPVNKLVVTLSARVDHWRNYDGHNLETAAATGLPTGNNRDSIDERSDTVVSPRAAALYHIADRVSVWGAANSGFRAPTLTELYRQFSVGAVTTFPKNDLGPERLVGGEIGVNVVPARNVSARLTWFDNRLSDPIANVTQIASFCSSRAVPAGCAQKQNLGATRVRGIQTDAEYRFASMWRVSGAYVFDDAVVTDGGTVSSLEGKYIPQVARHRGTFQIAYANPKVINVALGMLFVGLQYNDDLNTQFIPTATLADAGYDPTPVGLPGYHVVDLSISRDFGRSLQVFFGAQNLFDTVYFVQTNPSTLGGPRLVNGGVRVRWSGR